MTFPTTEINPYPSAAPQPVPLFTPTTKAAKSVLKCFTAQITNDRIRKRHLAVLHMLLDLLVAGNVPDVKPAHAVRGPAFRNYFITTSPVPRWNRPRRIGWLFAVVGLVHSQI